MGFFGTFVYSDGIWGGSPDAGEFLAIEIHDSDIATVDFQSGGTGGRFYLGFQPRDYWDDPSASDPVDVESQAKGLSLWAGEVLGLSVSSSEVAPLIAAEGAEEPRNDFVEETVAELIGLLKLPPPADLPSGL